MVALGSSTVCTHSAVCMIHIDNAGTSKYQSDEPRLGQHGTFLASLSATSLLTITSHHHAYRSHNSISFHQSQTIERQTPTAVHNHVHGKHGTRITVRNLFGNMPVRVKQRAMVTDQKTEQLRLRETLKRDVVGLLLSWQGPMSLKIRDGDNKTIATFNTSNAAATGTSRGAAVDESRSAHLSSLLHIMTQANYITIDQWPSWVPASASTAALSIRGAISLEPSPTKQVQFISFGIRPLSGNNGCNELYDEVNRLFAMSSFGTVEDDVDVDEQEQLRRQSDKRFKNDGYTNRQLKARKGVDRYPMFHLRISLKDRHASDLAGERFIENESNLQVVVGIFGAMITQWLIVHHFRPRNLQHVADRPKIISAPYPDEQIRTPSRRRQASLSTPARSATSAPESKSAAKDTTMKKRLAMAPLENSLGKPRPQAFADWSRIKSGKSSFFDTTHTAQKASSVTRSDAYSALLQDEDEWLQPGGNQADYAASNLPSVRKGALDAGSIAPASKSFNDCSAPNDKDETIAWNDPVTKKTHLINARTGTVVPPQRLQTNTSALSPTTTRLSTRKSLRMAAKSATVEPAKTPWLDGLLQTWDNPVFKPSEQGIQQMSLQGDLKDGGNRHTQHSHTHCSSFDMQKAFSNAGSTPARLSKDALRGAEVISQVDKKFILVRMAGSSADYDAISTTDIMVLVDQHAADERIQVEALLSGLCNPPQSGLHSNYQSDLGVSSLTDFVIFEKPLQFAVSPHEHTHFETFAASFASWGILYDTRSAAAPKSAPDMVERDKCKLLVKAVPPVIAERCKTDPRVLISFLRSAVWRYVESPSLPTTGFSDQSTNWVKRIATCPPGLLDMVNSRACRSAIMFNDELSLDDCKTLIKKLADCVFPFMCAHGRPSMVPIVDLGLVGNAGGSARDVETRRNGSFVDAWKKWRQ